MTGFGAGRAASGVEEVTVEVKTVNHKFCEVKVRLPRELAALEASVTRVVKERLTRGAIDVSVKRHQRSTTGLVPQVDLGLAREYRKVFAELASTLGIPDETSVRDLAALPNVVRLEEPQVDLEAAQKALDAALGTALSALSAMRAREGEALAADLRLRLSMVATAASEVKALSPRVLDEYRARLAERVAELSRGVPVDPQRLAQEVAIFADRTDVAEESTRLQSHLAQFDALLESPEPAGRKMDFLVQEMHREVNTTGSKSQHADISFRVVQLKAELERIREQVQNVE